MKLLMGFLKEQPIDSSLTPPLSREQRRFAVSSRNQRLVSRCAGGVKALHSVILDAKSRTLGAMTLSA